MAPRYKWFGGMFILSLISSVSAAWAGDNSIAIQQVSPDPVPHPAPVLPAKSRKTKKDKPDPITPAQAQNSDQQPNYQSDIISNPILSEAGRAAAMTHGGGNIATIIQEGKANESSIFQSGAANTANQVQIGDVNSLYLRQQGMSNHSHEKQVGNSNHKIIIQNGHKQETDETDITKHPDTVPDSVPPATNSNP